MKVEINNEITKKISNTISHDIKYVNAVIGLLQEGSTIPFIARYRKEVTNAMNEEDIREIDKAYQYQVNLTKRKEDIIRLIDEKAMLTEQLSKDINNCPTLSELEDIYRPFKEKKKTRATEAKRKGLEPLSTVILSYKRDIILENEAKKYLNDEILTTKEALDGAKDIIAEIVSANAEYRKWIRNNFLKHAFITATKKKKAIDEKGVYATYYDFKNKVPYMQGYKTLALNRAEREKILTVNVKEDNEYILAFLNRKFVKFPNSVVTPLIKEAIQDAYKRLIKPSIEREVRALLTEEAEKSAIDVFGKNLQQLLLQPPLNGKKILGVDPAYRTGCKMAVINEYGTFTDMAVIYPHQKNKGERIPEHRIRTAKDTFKKLVLKHKIDIVAVGNGTASRETEKFVIDCLKDIDREVFYIIVSEAGASVYSASKLAIEEFPKLQVEERSAISIARRLQDPLSELVKIDPKSIGVGQYQHDLNQKNLTESLDFVVTTTVNKIGVDINTASSALIQYISGLSKTIANNIVAYRIENGPFKARTEIKKVPKLGPKAFEQSAGFLRIFDGKNKLDETGIHPETYSQTKLLLKAIGLTVKDIGTEKLEMIINSFNKDELMKETDLGIHTLEDIISTLISPRRDIRDEIDKPLLKSDILKIDDIAPGMELMGTVRNIVEFGAFVDCGVKVDGLLHKSQISKDYVKNPMELLKVGQIVKVWVLKADVQRERLELTMVQSRAKS